MKKDADEPKVWLYQSDFLREARRLVERVFLRLGFENPPRLALVAASWWANEKYKNPPIADVDPTMLWKPAPEAWRDAIEQRTADLSETKALVLALRRDSASTVAFHDVIAEALRAHDASSATASFASQGTRVGSYDCVLVLEFTRDAFDNSPHVVTAATEKGAGLHVGVLKAAAETLLEHFSSEARKEDSGQRRIGEGDVENILRRAGRRLLTTVQATLGFALYFGDLFDHVNAISSLRYESSEAEAIIVVRPEESSGPFALRFKEKVPLSDAVWSRKTLELASESSCVISDSRHLLGVGAFAGQESQDFWIRLRGQNRWDVGCGRTPLGHVQLGILSFPVQRLQRAQFNAAWSRVFSPSDTSGMDLVWSVLEGLLENVHGRGALLVVTDKAAAEAERLASQATPIEPIVLDRQLATRATAVDGAILLDLNGTCHAIGTILDGESYFRGTPSRGARFNSALRYVMHESGGRRLAIVMSEDGQVDLLPRLRPQIRLSEFIEGLGRIREHPDGEALPAELRSLCIRFVKYLDYVQEDADRKKVVLGSIGNLEDFGRSFPIFDRHESDFIDDTAGTAPSDEQTAAT